MQGMMDAMSETNHVNKIDTTSRDNSVNNKHDEEHGHSNKHDVRMQGIMNAMSETSQVNRVDAASRDDSVNDKHDEEH